MIYLIGPTELSIADPQAVKALYSGQAKVTKGPWYTVLEPRVSLQMSRDKKEHARRRKVWDQGFSSKGAWICRITPCSMCSNPMVIQHCATMNLVFLITPSSFLKLSARMLANRWIWRSGSITTASMSWAICPLENPLTCWLEGKIHTSRLNCMQIWRVLVCLATWHGYFRFSKESLFSIRITSSSGIGLEAGWRRELKYDKVLGFMTEKQTKIQQNEPDRPDVFSWILDAFQNGPKTKQDHLDLHGDAYLIIVAGR